MNKKICSFCGHRDVIEAYVYSRVKNEIENLIRRGFNTFYSGGMGEFDAICERIVREFKRNNKNIRLCLILPYMTSRVNKNRDYYTEMYDEIILPDFGYIRPQRAIPERNRWIVRNSEAVLACVYRETGGARMTLEYAKKSGVECINICEGGFSNR